MPATADQAREYRQRLRQRALDLIGRVCVFCGETEGIQAAHVIETNIKGSGRGLDRRYRDVIKHPDSYRPMCRECHLVFDALWAKRLAGNDEPIPF